MAFPQMLSSLPRTGALLKFSLRTRSFVRSSTTNATDAKRPSSALRIATTVTVGVLTYGLGTVYPPQLATILFPRPAPPPLQPDHPEGIAQTATVESLLQSLPVVTQLREKSDDYYESRPYAKYPEEKRVNSLTAGSLRGPGKLAVPPILFAKHDETESIAFIHLGRSLCGHDGIIHGGLLATLLDESLARNAFMNLPGHIGVTANLNINYRSPTIADQVIKITTKLEEIRGRKAVVSGRVEDLSGKLLVDATGIFIEPKFAPLLKRTDVTQAIGKPNGKTTKAPIPESAV
ncbi:Thioesterase/thiol ester dehydrase-isomerase [Cantharellus anzutake]|uniref:Thioesterase/thiol ester dehydrase-isomerase n=1 Tax=Cantharellus anzutake TaxID=1750568 RepID=UPI001903904C|nr:Thioesterase/thiol ester dehydrase-isomerase [Cantharellus anzutake]KAF8342655.1 Thioesterase/thiol ester dehydrase-isomerase [Cantharellus anzutake]